MKNFGESEKFSGLKFQS